MASYLMTGSDPGRSNYIKEAIAPPLKLLWQWELPRNLAAVPSNPLQHKTFLSVCDVTFPAKTGHLFCLDSESGAELWKRSSAGMKAPALACICQDFVLWFSGCSGRMEAIDLASGSLVWRKEETCIIPDTIGVGNKVFFGFPGKKKNYYGVLDGITGNVIWQHEGRRGGWDPAYEGGRLYFLRDCPTSDNPSGWATSELVCVNFEDGRELWVLNFADLGRHFDTVRNSSQPGEVHAPIVSDDRIYCSLTCGLPRKLVCLDARNGSLLWTFEYKGPPVMPVPTGTDIVFTAFDNYYRLEAVSGRTLTVLKQPLLDFVLTTRGLVTDGVYWYGKPQGIYALEVSTGRELWSYGGRGIFYPPIVSNQKLYVCSDDMYVRCFASASHMG